MNNQTNTSNAGDPAKNKKATAGLVLGIIGMIFWIFPIFGLPLSIIGLIFGIKGFKSLRRGLAIAGFILSIIGLLLSVVNASIGVYQGITGQNLIVNQLSKLKNNENQIPQNQATQTPPAANNISPAKTKLINQLVQKVKAKMALPSQIDQATTLTDITAEAGAIRYHYVLSGVDTSQFSNDYLKNYLSPGICQNKDTKNILNQDINMEYSYSVKNSSQTYFVTFSKTDCK